MLKLYDLSDLSDDGIEVIQPTLSADSQYELTGDKLMMANTTVIYVVDIAQPGEVFYQKSINDVDHAGLCFTGSEYVLMTLSNGELSAERLTGGLIDLGSLMKILFMSSVRVVTMLSW